MRFDLRQFHEDERLVAMAQGVPGRLALWAAATSLLAWHGVNVVLLGAFAAVMLDPKRKRLWLSVAAVGMIFTRFLDVPNASLPGGRPWAWFPAAMIAATGAGALYLVYSLARRVSLWPRVARRYPVLTVHVGIWSALAVSGVPGLGALGWVPFLAWRLSYLAASASRGKLVGTKFRDHLFYLVPAWGGTTTPYGKGLDFLSKHEANELPSLARSQLAGIKLLLLAAAWRCSVEVLDVLAFGRSPDLLSGGVGDWLALCSIDWPRLPDLLRSDIHPALYVGWATLYLELLRATLVLAAAGHVIVGGLRLLGFNVFRNTYKPLLSESVVEFWNRYFYYFKELLVDFFFYPAYLRMRRLGPSSRLLVAVFAAAFVGNMYHHVLAHPDHVVHFDAQQLWASWSARLIYCFLLALGIWMSMLRQRRQRATGVESTPLIRLRRIAGVWTFYSVIQIWNFPNTGVSWWECTAFFLSLLGV